MSGALHAKRTAMLSPQHQHQLQAAPLQTQRSTVWPGMPVFLAFNSAVLHCAVPFPWFQICQVYDSAECVRNIHPDASWRQAATTACQVRRREARCVNKPLHHHTYIAQRCASRLLAGTHRIGIAGIMQLASGVCADTLTCRCANALFACCTWHLAAS